MGVARQRQAGGSGSRVRISADGQSLLYNMVSGSIEGTGGVLRIPLEGGDPVELRATGTHTDFVELPDGGYAILAWDLREVKGRKIMGDAIVEVAADGTTRTLWSVWDDFEPDLTQVWPSWYTPDPTVEDWSHINGIAIDPDGSGLYVTMTFNHGVAHIDRASGTLDWWFGDDGGLDWTGDRLRYPHSVAPIDGGVLVFERGDPAVSTDCSTAVTVRVDTEAGTAIREGQLDGDACTHVTFLGSALPLPTGNTLVTWTTAGRIDLLTPADEVAWSLQTTNWAGVGFSDWTEGLSVEAE